MAQLLYITSKFKRTNEYLDLKDESVGFFFFHFGWFNLVYSVFLCDHTTGCDDYSFITNEYGIFNVHTNLGACCTHEGVSGTNKSALELTRRGR